VKTIGNYFACYSAPEMGRYGNFGSSAVRAQLSNPSHTAVYAQTPPQDMKFLCRTRFAEVMLHE
jgi:hypothetical protein